MKEYFCGLLAYFKNERNGLNEWIMHHKKWGVQHIWLIDNGSCDDYDISDHINEGFVTVFEEKTMGQIKAYQKYLPELKQKVKWLGIVDMDEYMFSKQENDLKTILKTISDHITQILIQIKIFYPQTFLSPKSLIEKSTYYCAGSRWHPKCFYNLDLVDVNQGDMVHGLGKEMREKGTIDLDMNSKKLCVNHYQFGSFEYLYGIKEGRGGGVHKDKYRKKQNIVNGPEKFDTYLRDCSRDIIENCKLVPPKTELYPKTTWQKLQKDYPEKFELYKTYGNEEGILSLEEIKEINNFMETIK